YAWIQRFNEHGLDGLQERPRKGRPPTYTAQQRAEVVAAALTDPKGLGLPFGCWTLDRLEALLHEQEGIAIKRSRIDEGLTGGGRGGRDEEPGLGERVAPDSAERGGRWGGSTRPRRRARSSSASTRWGRCRPRATPGNSPSAPDRGATPRGAPPPGGPG